MLPEATLLDLSRSSVLSSFEHKLICMVFVTTTPQRRRYAGRAVCLSACLAYLYVRNVVPYCVPRRRKYIHESVEFSVTIITAQYR